MSTSDLSGRIRLLGILLSVATLSLTAGQSISYPRAPAPIEFQLTDQLCADVAAVDDLPGPTGVVRDGGAGFEDFDLICRSLRERQFLSGDWRMWRPYLQESGVAFRGTVTQFGFGIEGGIDAAIPPVLGGLGLAPGDRFAYTGRGEYDWIVDLAACGGKPGGKLLIGLQHWWGQYGNVSLSTGAFTPAIFPALLPTVPDGQGRPYLTDFVITQPLAGGKLVVYAGKKNVIGTADQDIFAGGDGTDQFMSQALIANPAFLLALPYSGLTAGFAVPRPWGGFGAFVYDPRDRTPDAFELKDLFADGVILGGEVKVKTNILQLPGQHHLGGLWKHLDLVDLRFQVPPPEYPYPPPPPGSATLPDSFTVYYGFDQYLAVFPGTRPGFGPQPLRRGWGLFGRASISDANPTPFHFFLSAGIGGDSRLGADRGDAFGLGWYYTGVSNEFGPVPEAALGPRDGTGVEMFYRFQALPWLSITPDVQYIRPGISTITAGRDAFVYGVRVNMKL